MLFRSNDDWHVFYSLNFLDRGSKSVGYDRQREIDFLLVHARFGLIFVEVKGGQVRFQSDGITQLLEGSWTRIDPERQLNGARRVCLEYLNTRQVGFIPARNLYIFPYTERPASGLSQELATAGLFKGDPGIARFVDHIQGVAAQERVELDIGNLQALLEPCLTIEIGRAHV